MELPSMGSDLLYKYIQIVLLEGYFFNQVDKSF